MNQLGYGLDRHGVQDGTRVIHWRREAAESDSQPTDPVIVTTLRPDFECDGMSELVYDRDYVIDLLKSVVGGNFAKNGKTLQALLQDIRRH
mgnify:FL=1